MAENCLSSTISTTEEKANLLRRSGINPEAKLLELIRDFSSSTASTTVPPDSMTITFNPEKGEINLAVSQNAAVPENACYKTVFHEIQPPNFKEPECMHANEEDMFDARFYMALSASSGYTFKMELVQGAKVYDINREVVFPTLSEIIRFQLTRKLETDVLSKTREIVFNSSRYQFLKNIYYPELSCQLDYFLTKSKLATQLDIAKKVLANRSSPNPAWTSFHAMSNKALRDWIADAEKFVNTRRFVKSPTKPDICFSSPNVFGIPACRKQFPYTFVRFDERASAVTSRLLFQCRKWRKSGQFLSSYATLSKQCPYQVLAPSGCNAQDVDNTKCIRDFMHFLSYGFFDLNKP